MTSTKKKAWQRAACAAAAGLLAVTLVLPPAVAAAAPISGAVTIGATTADQRGSIVSTERIVRLSRADVAATLAALPFAATPVRYAVDGYLVVYRTVDAHGAPTTASALVVFPRGAAGRLPTVSYGHGTRVYKGGVASAEAGNGDREIALMFASAGYATVAPDYLGLGTGPGQHPYMHSASEVTAQADALRATRALAGRLGQPLDGRVYATGFSQGATASMALGKAAQRGALAGSGLRIAGIAGLSGPYAIEHEEMPALLVTGDVDPPTGAFYLAYWTISMNRLYHLYDDPAEVFRAPYASTLPALYDGTHPEEEIFPHLPGSPQELLTDAYVYRLLHPTGAVARAIRDNDGTCDWRPTVPVRLYAATGDHDAPIANAYACQADLARHSVATPLVNVGDVDHIGSAILSAPAILAWFDQLRS